MTGAPRSQVRYDRGGVSLEYAGFIMVAALVVALAVVAIAANDRVTRSLRWAVCQVFTLGRGACVHPATTSAQPREPCVLGTDGYPVDAAGVTASFGVGDRASVVTERLSNGRHRVTTTSTSASAVGTSVGQVESRTWIVESRSAAEDIRSWAIYDHSMDAAALGGSTVPGFGRLFAAVYRPVSDLAASGLGLNPPRDPDVVPYSAGRSVTASADLEVLSGTGDRAGGSDVTGVRLAGVQLGKDGTVSVLGSFTGVAGLAGSLEADAVETPTASGPAPKTQAGVARGTLGFATTGDGTGRLVGVSVSEVDRRDDGGVTVTRRTFAGDADTPVPASWDGLLDAARARGILTRLSYAESRGLDDVGSAILAGPGGIGGSADLAVPIAVPTSAEYHDGLAWQPWEACRG